MTEDNKYYGIYPSFCALNKDPEQRGRIKVKCPEILGGSTLSAWCEPCVNVAYDNGGDFYIPVINEGVWIMFIDGDVNKPVWIGGWWQQSKTPLSSGYNDVDKIRIIKYADCVITMKNNMIDINIGQGSTELLINNGKLTIVGDVDITGNVTVQGYIHTTDDVVAGGISLQNHTHTGVHGETSPAH